MIKYNVHIVQGDGHLIITSHFSVFEPPCPVRAGSGDGCVGAISNRVLLIKQNSPS